MARCYSSGDVLCLLIADDLTGACDAAGPFAAAGFRTVLQFGEPHDRTADVLAISAETRGAEREQLPAIMAGVAARFAGAEARVLFKKIDSTLRGNVGAEVALACEAFGCDAALITPAFPGMGRRVERGVLRVEGAAFEPICMEEYWREQGLTCAHVEPQEAGRALESRFVSVNACSDEDLDAVVAAGMASGKRILWAGSAGLASALARAVGPAVSPVVFAKKSGTGVLFCIGSDHAVTREQQRRLLAERPGQKLLRIPRGATEAWVRESIGDRRRALLLSGGDTAALVCRALGVRAIEIRGEIAPGIPRGLIRGGLLDGAPVATKS
ncbi:MAG: four-carbon acid sugar kinase family protein, partial [Acidobacteriia bacterium]|nr:four-carbon acid sugar kinase family protein [Terriglobia bacterium]